MVRVVAFEDLTAAGRLRRLRGVASAALERYSLGEHRFALLAESFNTLYRVRTADGAFVLRVGPRERVHPAGAARAEAEWTACLAGLGLRTPRVVAAADGSASIAVRVDGVPGRRECSLLTWAPGRPLRRPVTAGDARELAWLAARLHAASADRPDPPTGALDGRSALLFDIPNRLGDLPAGRRALLADALARAQAAIDDLWRRAPRPPRLLHGDLTPNNVVRARQGLAVVDFQDLTWGHEQQDLAHTLFGLARDDTGGELARAFRASYESQRPWPDLDATLLADLFAARRLTMVNLTLTLRRPGLGEHVARHTAALRAYLRRC